MRVDLKKLRDLRQERKLGQQDVAQVLGYQTATGYHYIETGRVKLTADQIGKLAELFEVPIEELYIRGDERSA